MTAVRGRADHSTAAMRAVRIARPPPFDELCALLQQWHGRTSSLGNSSAGGDSVLLHGRPGCGKSTVARGLCAELDLQIFVVSAATLQLPRRKLEEALRRPGSVLVLEHLELLAPAAAQVGGGGYSTAALLPWLQKARCASAFVIGCCGQLAAVHPRVRRWFDDECELPPPSSSAHRRLLLALLRDRDSGGSCSNPDGNTGAAAAIEQLAAAVEPLCTAQSYVLADVVALVKEARLLAAMNVAAAPRGSAGSSAYPSPTLADFHAAVAQRSNGGFAGLGGVIDPPAPGLVVPTGGGPSEPAAAPATDDTSTASSHAVHWDDIGGLDEAKSRIEELVVWPYSRAAELRALGVRRPAVGLLLYGPPGTGKTMLARACAHQVKASFVALELSAIVGAHVGESERTLASVFASARRAAPAILFLDELDALFVGRSDASPGSTGSGRTDRLTTTLATELDRNADELASQLIVTSQQQQHQIETSGRLQSEGRLEAALSIGFPDRRARLHIAHKLLSFGSLKQMVDVNVTAELLADLTEPSANSQMRCSGADIKAIMGQALGTAVAEADADAGDGTNAKGGPGPTSAVIVTVRHVTEAAGRLRRLREVPT